MMADHLETEVLDHATRISAQELARILNVDVTWIETLHAHGVINENLSYSVMTMTRLRKARRLELDFNLNTEALAVVLDLLDHIDHLQSQLAQHRA